ncbi:MAG: hypothetical protein UX80_C0035G0008 [Candidatus Amesbacteria bacterium GW2011_GWA2_47_11b]|uniref:Uncharacterized protein n=2 Tax=Candidatus Amesiibacteriota TaxID=1752730 RepID=A0A0G1TQT0_9BACT|nr:MAG: hypothetical protein UX42_C0020G0003 [Microgenomates group bacterium GW2011_GWC1_46_20]KKU56533.1 MAG: hypothetical protein UX80_C0035G0008 [Candidatus Amesbacteria bacterium GW2011_GWA2_47_11b]KKU82489.1 MAG: hypothetical protein UY11_C0046G0009 [Candidatus Amesbacteria bacterium GW2011_GWC2_47_8]
MDYQLISLIAMGIAIAGVVVGYLDLKRRQHGVDAEADVKLKQAQEKAEKVLRQAQDKALEILERARMDTENRNEKLEIRLDRAEEKQVAEFKKAVGDAAPAILGRKIDEEFVRAKAEIGEYRKQKETEIALRAEELVRQVAKQALGKGLDMEKHKALIVAALEEAKSAHVL